MVTSKVADMTLEELDTRIEDAIDRRFQGLVKPRDSRSMEQLLELLDQYRFTPPPGSKSVVEMIREDRDA